MGTAARTFGTAATYFPSALTARPVPAENSDNSEKSRFIENHGLNVAGMLKLVRSILSVFARRFRKGRFWN
jgi:hypothetical protein